MPIYSNLYSNLARQGLGKTLTHGYAQSVVAATHPSSYPNQHNRTPFSRRNHHRGGKLPHTFKNAFHTSSSVGAASTVVVQRDPRAEATHVAGNHAGLAAYFDSWKKQHPVGEPEKEWTQFQFTKCIEWKPSAPEAEPRIVEIEEDASQHVAALRPALEKPRSMSALDTLKKVEESIAEEVEEEGRVTPELAQQIRDIHINGLDQVISAGVRTPPLSLEEFRKTPLSATAPQPSTSDLQSLSYAEHLTKLSQSERFAEIPAVFESMLVAGIKPVAESYNALLDAAIHFPCEKIQVVPKALDVYSDMLRRKVTPNTATYNTLISIMAERSLEINGLKKSLEEKRTRFGGMDKEGTFMLASSELEFDILSEDDRLDYAIQMFDIAMASNRDRVFPAETYYKLIAACAEQKRITDMARFYDDMDVKKVVPLAATFTVMINAYASVRDLVNAVEVCYTEYRDLAVADNYAMIQIPDRQDARVYAAVVKAYIDSDKMPGAMEFFEKIADREQNPAVAETIIAYGLVDGLIGKGVFADALAWAEKLDYSSKVPVISKVAVAAADAGDSAAAMNAFSRIPHNHIAVEKSAIALLARCIRSGQATEASRFWQILSAPETTVSAAFIEPTAMYALALIRSGHVAQGLTESELMFRRIKDSAPSNAHLADEVDEGIHLIQEYAVKNNIVDPRVVAQPQPVHPVFFQPPHTPVHFNQPIRQPAFEDSFDPHAASTDFKGSALIADDLERGMASRVKASRLNEALARFGNIRRAGRHPRYITYAKLISAAAREGRTDIVHDVYATAKTDVPMLPQYQVVRYGWVSILDAMVGACLTIGNRSAAAQFHQELREIGAAPTANTFGLYITTLKESTRTFDEASEAVKIFHQAKSEGVEPSSFLYNALIGKLGKARRIDDCLFYFAEMRALGIRPTSVTYGTIVNALCRVSDEKFAEELFEEMESMPNYKARPAPYNSLMQFFLTTKRDKQKVLEYYNRMTARGIQPTSHTYKLLVDTHATLEPVNMAAAEAVLDSIRASGEKVDAVHYASLIHAKGCVLHDIDGARSVFDSVMANASIHPAACLFQAMVESLVAAHRVSETSALVTGMTNQRVELTPYIANSLIHGWAAEGDIIKAAGVYAMLGRDKREPSTYEAMTRAYVAKRERASAMRVVQEMLGRGYPAAVSSKILDIVGFGAEN